MSGLPDPESTMEVSPLEVAGLMEALPEQRPLLVDCRERDEVGFCRIDGCCWIPLADIPHSIDRLRGEADQGVVVYCHHGMRSLHAVACLRASGIERSFSMAGGIERWSRDVDPAVPRY